MDYEQPPKYAPGDVVLLKINREATITNVLMDVHGRPYYAIWLQEQLYSIYENEIEKRV
jgi:hypothetical protein